MLTGGEYRPATAEIVKSTPGWMVALAWTIIGLGYAIVNHTQSMRLFGARSEWDLKMAVVVSGLVLIALNFTNLMIGIAGRALYPDPGLMPLAETLQVRDSTFPLLVRELTSFYVREVPERGVAATTSSLLSPVPRVAQATSAAGNGFLPASARGGRRRGLARPLRRRRVGPCCPRASGPVPELGRPVATIPARPERKHG